VTQAIDLALATVISRGSKRSAPYLVRLPDPIRGQSLLALFSLPTLAYLSVGSPLI